MLFVGTSIIHPSTEGVFLLCNILDLLIYSYCKDTWCSESTARIIDEEVQKIISEQYERAKKILAENTEGHNQLANVLLEREVIYREDVEHIFGKRPWASRSEEILEKENKDDKNDKNNPKEQTPAPETGEEAPKTEDDKS